MWNETLFWLALGAALLVYVVDYAFGQPGNEKWNDSELLSAYAFFLAKRRLLKDDAYKEKVRQLIDSVSQATTLHEKKLVLKSFRQAVFAQARGTFYWEKAIGMCPICFHFWVCLAVFGLVKIFYFDVNIFAFILWSLVSHLFIRLLKKFV